MKRTWLLALICTLLLALLPCASADDFVRITESGCTYRLNKDDTAVLIAIDPSLESAVIPAFISNHTPVTYVAAAACDAHPALQTLEFSGDIVIKDGAFANCPELREVNILSDHVEVRQFAFNSCPNLTTVRISGEAEITWAFQECTALTKLEIPNAVKLGGYAFSKCTALESVEIPAGITQLSTGVFYDCTALRSVSLPDGLSVIGECAFNGCTALNEIDIPASVTEIGEGAFERCGKSLDLEKRSDSQPVPETTPEPEPTAEPAAQPLDPLVPIRDIVDNFDAGEIPVRSEKGAYAGKLMIAVENRSGGFYLVTRDGETFDVPDEYIADSLDEADTLILIRGEYRNVGSYGTAGGINIAALETTTTVRVFDPNGKFAYAAENICVEQPPETITIRTNQLGIPIVSEGAGTLNAELAIKAIIENHVDAPEIPDVPDAVKSDPVSDTDDRYNDADTALPVSAILNALDNDLYRAAFDAASADGLRKGAKGDAARGLQTALIALSCDISADGSAGSKTMEALNTVRAAFGEEPVDALDADGMARLLAWVLISTDEDTARDVLSDMDADEFEYLCACALDRRGNGYLAMQRFLSSSWKDSDARAAACEKPLPKSGVLFRDASGKKMTLTLDVNAASPDSGSLFKIYDSRENLVACVFVNGSGKASVKLPGGTYTIKMGTGTKWYGLEDAFGSSGNYQIMTFDGGAETVQLKSGYTYTLTINTVESSGDSVGSEYETWSDF